MATSKGEQAGDMQKPIWNQSGEDHQQATAVEHSGQRQQPRVNLTKEEMETLQQCSREAFYYRCVPLGILFVGGTQMLVNRGFLNGHPRLGALPKNMFAALVAYIGGKISYQGECRRKIMTLDNSPLGEALRKGKRGRELMTDMSMAGFGATSEAEVQPSAESNTLQESYLESSGQGSGLDDAKRPTLDSSMEPRPSQESQASYVTYDELRKRNRLDYEKKTNPLPSSGAPSVRAPQTPIASSADMEPRSRRIRTNKYGDVIEE